eukprot:TRINITY_DN727_c0_g3_i4.p1 TRINITY_DN727_c0_g3~~TRINITY_DN727_c0_g3_i4.p1  ORF type:complete len:624 (+),score=230.45 TRINITY_DN727_c0_g3_i4:35-1873(+)
MVAGTARIQFNAVGLSAANRATSGAKASRDGLTLSGAWSCPQLRASADTLLSWQGVASDRSALQTLLSQVHMRPSAARCRQTVMALSSAPPKKILLMGGSRFIGVYLARLLVKEGHEVTLFTRGKAPVTSQIPGETDAEYAEYSSKVKHLKGDRMDYEKLKQLLAGSGFQAVYDINGREAEEALPIIEALPNIEQYIFCSSAGVYLKSDQLPHREVDAVDPKSRHKGKLDTEALLREKGVPWTSIRPVYIYGPLNYNPVEEWFFQRLAAKRPIPIPSSGRQVTQLGHIKDLARAFVTVLGKKEAIGEVFNISGPKYATFDGIANACAQAMGLPPPELVHYKPKEFDFGKKKSFPLRDQHFFASNEKAEKVLGWSPEFDLLEGLKDSYSLDFGRGTFRKAADFSTDDIILAKLGRAVPPPPTVEAAAPAAAAPAAPVSLLKNKSLSQLRAMARLKGLVATSKPELIHLLSAKEAKSAPPSAAAAPSPPPASAAASSTNGAAKSTSLSLEELEGKSMAQLRALAKEKGLRGDTRAEIIKLLLDLSASSSPAPPAKPVSAPVTPPPAAAATAPPRLSQAVILQSKSLAQLRAMATQKGLMQVRTNSKEELIRLLS